MDENKIEEKIAEDKTKATNNTDGKKSITIPIMEITLIVLLILSLWLYMSPKFLMNKENRQTAILQTNASIFTSKILAEFSQNPKAKASEAAIKVAKDLNEVNENPMNKKNPAYSLGIDCLGCVVIKTDDKLNTVIISGQDKEKTLLVRTVIRPPSYVTYVKDVKLEAEKTKNNGK